MYYVPRVITDTRTEQELFLIPRAHTDIRVYFYKLDVELWNMLIPSGFKASS